MRTVHTILVSVNQIGYWIRYDKQENCFTISTQPHHIEKEDLMKVLDLLDKSKHISFILTKYTV